MIKYKERTSLKQCMPMKPCQNIHVKGNWYIIFCDNFFTSAKLIEDLYNDKILCCGTLRSRCKGFPAELFEKML